MKSWGILIPLLLVAGIVISAGCINPFAANQSGTNSQKTLLTFTETPTLPDQYVAQPAITPTSGLSGNTIPTRNATIPLVLGQSTTINGTGLSGNSSNSTTTVTLNGTVVSIPIAQFTTDKTMGFAPCAVQFTDNSLNLPVSWYWDFGDGGSSTLQNPPYTFTQGGEFSVVFTATNAAGSNSFTKNISVYAPGFSAIPGQGPAPLTVTFTDTGKGSPLPTAWFWDFGDGKNSNLRNSTHQYAVPGTYDVGLRVTGAQGTAWVNRSAAVTVT